MTRRLLRPGLLAMVMLINACSDDELSPEAEIRAYLENGVEAAESRSSSDLMALVDDDYQDDRGLDKLQLTNLLRLQFFRHKNIHLFTKIDEIELITENEAIVKLHVAMAASAISDASVLSSLRAQIYQFELELSRQDEWLLQRAKWQRAGPGDMQ